MSRLRLKETQYEREERQRQEIRKELRKNRRRKGSPTLHHHHEADLDPKLWKLSEPDILRVPSDVNAAYDQTKLHFEGGRAEGPSRPPKSPPIDYEQIKSEMEEARFRAKLFDAMEDDMHLENLETRFNSYHVPNRWGANANEPLEPGDMDDEEYIEWIRKKMWERKHKAEIEERDRLRKERQKQREREFLEEERRKERRAEKAAKQTERRAAKAQEDAANAFTTYLDTWNRLNSTQSITFASIPWPVFSFSGTDLSQLSRDAISAFLLSPHHSGNKSRKQRLREAILAYHPDRFDRWLALMPDQVEREQAREAAGIVVRNLNALAEAE